MARLWLEVIKVKGKLTKFLKNNSFYLALAIGAVALFGAIGVAGLGSQQEESEVAENAAGFTDGEPESEGAQAVANDEVAEATKDNNSGLDYTEEYDADMIQDILSQIEESKADEAAEVAQEEAGETEEGQDAVATSGGVSGTPFDETQTLAWPVDGEVVLDYSMETTTYYKTLDQYKVNPGVLISANVNSEVMAAYAGTVEDIMTDAQLGTVVVINMGNNSKAYYGQVKDVAVAIGDTVEKNQVIATVAEPTKYFTEEGSHINFRVTMEEQPIDPVGYFE